MSNYTLHLGDCLEYMRTMPDKSVDAVITDPPYGISASSMRLGSGRDLRYGNWDVPLKREQLDKLLSVGKKTIIWGGNYYANWLPASRAWLVWFKDNPNLSFAEAELAWTNLDMVVRLHRHYAPGMDGGKVHITQKPESLMRWCISFASNEGDTIFDPFMGSGTTGVACMQLGRNFIGCEIDPNYYAIAEKRIKDAARQILLPL